jgi:hypothetical protein
MVNGSLSDGPQRDVFAAEKLTVLAFRALRFTRKPTTYPSDDNSARSSHSMHQRPDTIRPLWSDLRSLCFDDSRCLVVVRERMDLPGTVATCMSSPNQVPLPLTKPV